MSSEWTGESADAASTVSGGDFGELSGGNAVISSDGSSGEVSGSGSGDARVSLDWERSEFDIDAAFSANSAEESEAEPENLEDQEADFGRASDSISSGDLIYYVPSGSDAVTVANIPDYTSALIAVVLGLGLISGILFGRLAAWR